jgi:chitinase
LTGVSITTLAVAPTGATVRVTFGGVPPPPSDTTPPSQPGSLQATPLDTSRVSLSWAASTDNVGVTGYRILRNSALVTTVTGTGWTDTGLAPSTTYPYQVVALDAAGNASTPASASATTPASPHADTTPPSAPTNLSVTPGKGKKIVLAWTASTDNIGVAGYRVLRDETQVGQTQATTYTDTLGGNRPTATYVVVAYDLAGNVSAPSSTVSVP